MHRLFELIVGPPNLVSKNGPPKLLILQQSQQKLPPKPHQKCTYTRIVLKQDRIHKLLKDLRHAKSILLRQREERLRPGQEPRFVRCEDDQGNGIGRLLQRHLHRLDQIAMLPPAVHHICHDQDIEARRPSRQVRQQRFHRAPPLISVNVQGRVLRDQRCGDLRIVAHVTDEIGIRVVSHHGSAGAHDRGDNTGDAGSGADLEHIFAGDEFVCMFFDVVGACSAGIPKKVTLAKRQLVACERQTGCGRT